MDWISVKDRLPREDVSVLVCLNYMGDRIVEIWQGVDTEDKAATHWMLLPPLPSPDTEEIKNDH